MQSLFLRLLKESSYPVSIGEAFESGYSGAQDMDGLWAHPLLDDNGDGIGSEMLGFSEQDDGYLSFRTFL